MRSRTENKCNAKKEYARHFKISDAGSNIRKIIRITPNLGMIKETADKGLKLLENKERITLKTPAQSNYYKTKHNRPLTSRNYVNTGHKLEDFDCQASENDFKDDANLLYQGGTFCGQYDTNDNFRALPLSVAEITFKNKNDKSRTQTNFNKDNRLLSQTRKNVDLSILNKRKSKRLSVVTLTPFSNQRSVSHTPNKTPTGRRSKNNDIDILIKQDENQSPLKPKYTISKRKSKSVCKINTSKAQGKLNLNQLNDLINKKKVNKIVESLNPNNKCSDNIPCKIDLKAISSKIDTSQLKSVPDPSPLTNEFISLSINNFLKQNDWKKIKTKNTNVKSIKRSIIKRCIA